MPYARPVSGVYLTASDDYTHGQAVLQDNLVGVATKQAQRGWTDGFAVQAAIDTDERFYLITHGIVQLGAVSGAAEGDPVYISDGNVLSSAPNADEVQVITLTGATSGTFTLTFDGQTTSAIAYGATSTTVRTALVALSNIAPGDVAVTGPAGGPWTVTFGGAYDDTDVAEITVNASGLNPAVNEVQTVTVDATAGQFKLTYSAQQTADIAFDAVAATVQAALVALSNIAPGDVVVTGGPGNSGGTTPYILTFGGALAGTNLTQTTGVTGTTPLSGGGAAITTGTSTQGSAGGGGSGDVDTTGEAADFTYFGRAVEVAEVRGVPAAKVRIDLDA